MKIPIKLILISYLLLFLAGCASFEPRVLPENRQNLNRALLRSDEEQLLINIVSMQYGDRPYFLDIDNITTNENLTSSINNSIQNVGYSYQKTINRGDPSLRSSATSSYNLIPGGFSYNQSPTVIYTPIKGEKFTRQVLSPVTMEDIYLFIRSGWSVARIFRVMVESVGELDNASSASRPSTKHVPDFKDFINFAHYLRELYLENLVTISGEKQKDNFFLDINIKDKDKNNPKIKKLFKILKINHWENKIRLSEYPSPGSLHIITRSFIGVLYYLAKSVQVSEQDIREGVVIIPRYPNGKRFDWNQLTTGMMKIYSSTSYPKNATVTVYYRGRWFYIADNDIDSKETLALLQQLYSLRSGEGTGRSPLITLPV